jgi:hypothetical protein
MTEKLDRLDSLGDVYVGEDGAAFATVLDNAGNPHKICIEPEHFSSVVISLLRTIKWVVRSFAHRPPAQSSKGVRKTSLYNIHISKELRRMSSDHPEMSRADRMRHAVNSWKDVAVRQRASLEIDHKDVLV